MAHPGKSEPKPRRPQYLVAMVVGTALSAFGTASAAEMPEVTARAVSDMSRYCTACWRNARLHPDCWTDCTQEVLCRLLERVAPDDWSQVLKIEGEERREFLRAIDTVKKRTQRGKKFAALPEFLADRREARDRCLASDRQMVAQAAADLLSDRQQQILALSFDGWPVYDIAKELRLPAERVSDEKYKAIRKLRERFVEQI